MKAAFFSHSPCAAHNEHNSLVSMHLEDAGGRLCDDFFFVPRCKSSDPKASTQEGSVASRNTKEKARCGMRQGVLCCENFFHRLAKRRVHVHSQVCDADATTRRQQTDRRRNDRSQKQVLHTTRRTYHPKVTVQQWSTILRSTQALSPSRTHAPPTPVARGIRCLAGEAVCVLPMLTFIFISVIERRICHASPTMAAREIRCTW